MYRVFGSFALLAVLGSAVPVQGQWFEWVDDPTGIVCGLINAENVRLVQSEATGNLILVNGTDRELVNTSVDDFGQVIIEGQLAGFVEYARDAEDKTITVRTASSERFVIIEVQDQGPGVPHRQRKKVFEQFYRLGSEATRETTGTGLGLALVKKFAQAHNGFVEILTTQPTGVIFRVALAARVESY